MAAIESISCPDEHQHRALLDDQLDEASRQRILQHLQECVHCQAVCESLVAGLEEVGFPTVVETISRPDESKADELDRIVQAVKERLPLGETSSSERERIDPSDVLALGGDFCLVQRLGQGAQGIVYLAKDLTLHRDVVIKLLAPRLHASSESIERFKREARSLASIQSPFVVPIYRVGELPSGRMYMVMAYVQGTTLRELHRSSGIGVRQAADYARQIAVGLSAVHSKNLVHRDIKPENILIDGANGQVRIADFGLAFDCTEDSRITMEGTLAGTPAYMSPEQVLSPLAIDARADVYGLGVVLYELLSSQVPFRGTPRMTLLHLVHDDPVSPRTYNEQIPKDLETICLRALAKDPSKRFQSAAEFSKELDRFLNDQPIHSRPIGRIERAWKKVKRNPVVSSLVATIALLVCLAIGISAAYAIHFRKLNKLAEHNALIAKEQRDSALTTLVDLVFQLQRKFDSDDIYIDDIQQSTLEIAMRGLEKVEGLAGNSSEGGLAMAVALRRLAQTLLNLDRREESIRCLEKSESILQQLLARLPKNEQVVLALAETTLAYDECSDMQDESNQLNRYAFAVDRCRELLPEQQTPEFTDRFATLLTYQARCQMQNQMVDIALETLREAQQLVDRSFAQLSQSDREMLLITSLEIQTYTVNALRLQDDPAARPLAIKVLERISALDESLKESPTVIESQLSNLQSLGCLSSRDDEQVDPRWQEMYSLTKKQMIELAESDGQQYAVAAETVMILANNRINEGIYSAAKEFLGLRIELAEARLARLPRDSHALTELFDSRFQLADLELARGSRRSHLRALDHCFRAFECMERMQNSGELTQGDWESLTAAMSCMVEAMASTRDGDSQSSSATDWSAKILGWAKDESLTKHADQQDLEALRSMCHEIMSAKRL